jgi:orotidine-5'-phosphate decarboxylase
MTRQQLIQQIQLQQSYLCVGLDTDPTKIPIHLQYRPNAVFEFNKAIIDATKEYCVSYKINTAFYEAMGIKGWEAMEQTVDYIPASHLKIADAKRGDTGNTSAQYAKAFFETMKFDAITVAPYMGEDSIRPFLEYEDKWTIVLGLTSNKGAADFEMQRLMMVGGDTDHGKHDTDHGKQDTDHGGLHLYEKVISTIAKWGTEDNLMFVIGATKAAQFAHIRTLIPNHFLLVPGVGAQGGSLAEVSHYGMSKDCGLLVNASRAIIFASDKENFAEEAQAVAKQYQTEMAGYLQKLSFPSF